MASKLSPLAGKTAAPESLVDIAGLLDAYVRLRPQPTVAAQRVAFGTSGHRGSSLTTSFNEHHVLAITQAVCEYRARQGIDGPLFVGIDTHALSQPAFESVIEVLAGNGVQARVSQGGEFTPTPAVSHAILAHNAGRDRGLADGIVVTPSHNPPADGGLKYNAANGGPAESGATGWIQDRANALLEAGLAGVKRLPYAQARRAPGVHEHDFLGRYVADLGSVIDFDVIRDAGIRLGVDPLGGAGVHYWARIAAHYRIDLEVVSEVVDPQFAFMTLDWDGKARMDPSSRHAMRGLIALKDRYDVAFACDTDHDRHGIVAPSVGLVPANHFASVAADQLFGQRPQWPPGAALGKTVVSSAMIDRVAARHGRALYEVPVGFKWFAGGLFDGSLGFACEESAGASLLRRDGSVWTTDKDGIALALLAGETTARTGRDPGELYRQLSDEFGEMFGDRVDAPANAAQRRTLATLSPAQVASHELAGDPIDAVLDRAPGNDAPIGGIKVTSCGGWFAARPSGTEDIYKIYAESYRDNAHLHEILAQAQAIVDAALDGT